VLENVGIYGYSLAKAAQIMAQNPVTLQLRYFQTLSEIAAEHNSTIIVPSEVSGLFRSIRGMFNNERKS
jgi:hypothetical protein